MYGAIKRKDGLNMNPFEERPISLEGALYNWETMYPEPYNKRKVDPYTKARIILMNGTEFEANWFSHQMSRHTDNNDLRRAIALTRECEKQQQLRLALLKPADESIIEHTIGYEQLAVDLTAELAKREECCSVKQALDFALLEDFDHLYRYADLLNMTEGVHAENLVGRYTEIMPGRPTVAHHRHPFDNVRCPINSANSSTATVLATMIITGAEQQTMNYYMNSTPFVTSEEGRRLYEEIALVEEEHVTHYGALLDPNATWLEMLLWHEYCECYLYWSCYMTECDMHMRDFWYAHLITEIAHLHNAAELLHKYEGKEWQQVIKDPTFPKPLSLHENIEYVRGVLRDTVQFTTGKDDTYVKVDDLAPDADFYRFQHIIQPTTDIAPSHNVIMRHIRRHRRDYRYEVRENPHPELRCRTEDNTKVGIERGAAYSSYLKCN